tara:strand:+ start:103 stop:963 length:861 start_codon:yes stop_codon:yes gene_type:complete
MIKFNFLIAAVMLVFLSCSKDDNLIEETIQPTQNQGYNMLLIGNSFFRPYAEKLNVMAVDAGFENHSATVVFRGGDNGRPINFWNDATSTEHNEIKMALDQGNIDFFGMTAGKLPDNPTDGFREWINYALQNNPDITIFLSIPPPDFPANWGQLAQDMGFSNIQETYSYFVSESIHNSLVDQLRAEFPSTTIFTIPTGWAAINLAQMKLDTLLLDQIEMFGSWESSIFTDQKGHQGDIVKKTGGLVWLNSIYNVDLSSNTYNTGYNTDLHEIASQIMDSHDLNYKQ